MKLKIAVLLFVMGLFGNALASNNVEHIMQFHREFTPRSKWYERSLSEELRIPLTVVQDFLNIHLLLLTESTVSHVARAFFHPEHAKRMEHLDTLFFAHRLAYWGLSAYQYASVKPAAFFTNTFLYLALWRYVSPIRVPETTFFAFAGMRTK